MVSWRGHRVPACETQEEGGDFGTPLPILGHAASVDAGAMAVLLKTPATGWEASDLGPQRDAPARNRQQGCS